MNWPENKETVFPMNDYSMRVSWSEEDEAFVALCDEFPEASAFGDSREHALEELVLAVELLVEVYQVEKRALPLPRVLEEMSGQFRVRVPKFIHRRLVDEAFLQGVSLNTLINSYLALGLGGTAVGARRVEFVNRPASKRVL